MTAYRILVPETRDGATVYRTYLCSTCKRMIYQAAGESVWIRKSVNSRNRNLTPATKWVSGERTQRKRYYHELCKLQLEAKLQKESK